MTSPREDHPDLVPGSPLSPFHGSGFGIDYTILGFTGGEIFGLIKRTMLIMLVLCLGSPALARDWTNDALRLSGESNYVTQTALRNLAKRSAIDRELTEALRENSTRTFLALDVIASLKKESLVDEVIQNARNDRSGFFFLALNSFFNSKKKAQILKLFQDCLADAEVASPVKMVILDTFGRVQIPVPTGLLRKFLQDGHEPELRSAALYYLRSGILHSDPEAKKQFAELGPDHRADLRTKIFTLQKEALSAEIATQTEAREERR